MRAGSSGPAQFVLSYDLHICVDRFLVCSKKEYKVKEDAHPAVLSNRKNGILKIIKSV